MYEKLNETKEFDELSEREQNEYFNRFQDDLENQDNDSSDDLSRINGSELPEKIASDVSKAIESDAVKTVSDTIREFEQKFDAKTVIDNTDINLTEYINKMGDVATDKMSTYSDYICKSYVITDGAYQGMTRPERLDITFSDVIENNSNIVGEPLEDMKEHQEQEMPNSCAIACQKYAIEALTGREVEESELRDIGKNFGYTDSGGTPFCFSGKVAEQYGLKSEFHSSLSGESLTLDNAMQRVNNGERLIAAADTSMLYYPEMSESPFAPFKIPKPNHAVEIIGFDTSNPDDIKVIINDPGFADGAGNIYSWDTFKNCTLDSFVSIHK